VEGTIGFVNCAEVKEKEALSTLAHKRWIKFPAAVVKQVWHAGAIGRLCLRKESLMRNHRVID
jgi:hypothetical protein